MKKLSVLVILALAASASAAVIEDFESYNLGDSYGTGTIVADPDNAGNKVLRLVNDGGAQYATVAVPGAPVGGIVGMDFYDRGITTASHYGPRWGIGGEVCDTAAYLRQGAGINNASGYGMSWDNQPTSGWSRTGSWFSAKFFGGPRLVDALEDPAADPPVLPDGAWSTWTFTAAGGPGDKCYIDNGTASNVTGYATGKITDVWFWSGKDAAPFADGLFDNITFDVPEPATMSLLALGGLAMLRRRK